MLNSNNDTKDLNSGLRVLFLQQESLHQKFLPSLVVNAYFVGITYLILSYFFYNGW